MQLEENGTSRAGLAENFCGHSSVTIFLNILFEPREAKPRFGGEIFYAVLCEPREAEPPLGGEAFYAG
jgi:hypothetical protein